MEKSMILRPGHSVDSASDFFNGSGVIDSFSAIPGNRQVDYDWCFVDRSLYTDLEESFSPVDGTVLKAFDSVGFPHRGHA
jgi:hypothetical protein